MEAEIQTKTYWFAKYRACVLELGVLKGRAARSVMCSVHSLKFQEYPSHGSRDTDEKALPSPSNFPLL